jgi:alpha-1,6-mannosyltransferase
MDTEWFPFIFSAFGFVGLYSCLGHKEMRFLFPVMPLWNLAAAIGMSRIHSLVFMTLLDKINGGEMQQHQNQRQPKRTMIALLGLFAVAVALVLSLVASWSFVAVSRWNYPGGMALQQLQDHVVTSVTAHHRGGNTNDHDNAAAATVVASLPSSLKVHAYIDVASAMTGVSLFGQHAAELSSSNQVVVWSFDKKGYESENASVNDSQWSAYTHILTEDPDLTNDTANGSLFQRVGTIQGHPRLDWRSGGRIVTSNAIYILEQKDWIRNQITAADSSTARAHPDYRQDEQEDFAEASSTARIEL